MPAFSGAWFRDRVHAAAALPGDVSLDCDVVGPTSRMFVNDMASSVRRVLSLKKEVQETEAALAPPEASRPDGVKE